MANTEFPGFSRRTRKLHVRSRSNICITIAIALARFPTLSHVDEVPSLTQTNRALASPRQPDSEGQKEPWRGYAAALITGMLSPLEELDRGLRRSFVSSRG